MKSQTNPSTSKFLSFQAKISSEKVLFESTGELSSTLYTIHLHPVVILKNNLPMPISFAIEGTDDIRTLDGGDKMSLFNAKPGATKVKVKVGTGESFIW